ncbi:MAG: hypothetical protein RL385_4825, partial [Pseudomonadota bacterium]
MRRESLAALYVAAAGFAGCLSEDTQITEVVVAVSAEPAVAARVSRLVVRIKGADAPAQLTSAALRHEQTIVAPAFPLRIAMSPLHDDADRKFWLEVTAVAADQSTVSQARIYGSYEPDALRTLTLTLEDACQTFLCTNVLETCSKGACVAAAAMDVVLPITTGLDAGVPSVAGGPGIAAAVP